MDRLLPDGTSLNSSDGKLHRNKFTRMEDERLLNIIKAYGKTINWKKVSEQMKTRSPRQCRERYNNYLSKIENDPEWTALEDSLLSDLILHYGQKWNIIRHKLLRHSDLSIKLRWEKLNKPKRKVLFDSTEIPKVDSDDANCSSALKIDLIFDRLYNELPRTDMFCDQTLEANILNGSF